MHPVAAEDYWNKNRLRRYLSRRIFRAVLIPRHANKTNVTEGNGETTTAPQKVNALTLMQAVLDKGESLIIFS
ncbi:acyltransferase [Proteus mirabilis]|uniref:Acyltransferase n=1 Tax=Proteus mirabilis TaxID=584 RepID=A0A2X2C395_PROMI|nr:acyltransferase [Proteus mirabilis]